MMGSGLFRYHWEGEAPSEPVMTWIIAPMLADFTIRLGVFGFGCSAFVHFLASRAAGLLPDAGSSDSGLWYLPGSTAQRGRGGLRGHFPPWLLALSLLASRLSRWGQGLPWFGTAASVLVAVVASVWLGAASSTGFRIVVA